MRHVTFELGTRISSGSTQLHHSESSELSQVPSFVTSSPQSESPPPQSELLPPLETDSEPQSGTELEGDDLTSSGTDSRSVQQRYTKSKHRAIPSPRARRHINHIARVGPAGNKRVGKALDVWSFVLTEEGENICIFCKYVITLSSLHI